MDGLYLGDLRGGLYEYIGGLEDLGLSRSIFATPRTRRARDNTMLAIEKARNLQQRSDRQWFPNTTTG